MHIYLWTFVESFKLVLGEEILASSPVLFLFEQAEQALMGGNLDKEYAPIGGTPEFCLETAKLAFGDNSPVIKDGRVSEYLFCPIYDIFLCLLNQVYHTLTQDLKSNCVLNLIV